MPVETCHGCVYLGGHITANEIYAQCGEQVWQGERITQLGREIARPSKCTNKTLRDSEQNNDSDS